MSKKECKKNGAGKFVLGALVGAGLGVYLHQKPVVKLDVI